MAQNDEPTPQPTDRVQQYFDNEFDLAIAIQSAAQGIRYLTEIPEAQRLDRLWMQLDRLKQLKTDLATILDDCDRRIAAHTPSPEQN
jgi:hypothetical protein